jgi:hypothetical protein
MATSSIEKEQARDTGPPAASIPMRSMSVGVASEGTSEVILLIIIPLKAKAVSRGVAEKVKNKRFQLKLRRL